jgi:hypothetical protein
MTKQKHFFGSAFCFALKLIQTNHLVFPQPHRLLTASSPKRSQCEMKRGEDGAAVKFARAPSGKQILGTARDGSLVRVQLGETSLGSFFEPL